MTKKTNGFTIPVAMTLIFLIVSCSSPKTDESSMKNSDQRNIFKVEVVTIKEVPCVKDEAIESFLYADKDAFITTKVSGVIEEVYFELGDHVEEGDTLARIEDELLSLEAKSAQNRFNQYKQDFERGQTLFDKKLISESEYEQIKLKCEQADIEGQLALEKLRQSRLITPFSGVVVSKWARIGQVVNVGDTVFHVTEMFPVYTRVFLTEEELFKLGTENQVRIMPRFGTNRSAWGRIVRKSPIVDPATGTVEVVVRVDKQYSFLKPGMSVGVYLKPSSSSAILAVPKAVFPDPEELYPGDTVSIYFCQNGKALRKIARLGADLDSLQEIQGEFKTGDSVILKSPPGLKNGLEVKLEPRASAR